MLQMAKQFKQNTAEDDLAGELDSLVYRSQKVDANDVLNANSKLRTKPEDLSEAEGKSAIKFFPLNLDFLNFQR